MIMMRERFDVNMRVLEVVRVEFDFKQFRFSSLDREYRVNLEDIRKVYIEVYFFREQVAFILFIFDERCDIFSDFILNRIKIIF